MSELQSRMERAKDSAMLILRQKKLWKKQLRRNKEQIWMEEQLKSIRAMPEEVAAVAETAEEEETVEDQEDSEDVETVEDTEEEEIMMIKYTLRN